MTREDLFEAIGQVEEERLARCACDLPSNGTELEENDMEMQTKRRRPVRLLLIAAALVAVMAVSVMAADWVKHDYKLYENPDVLLEAMLGENGIAGYEGGTETPSGEVNTSVNNAFERVPLDKDLAEKYIEPYLYEVGKMVERHFDDNGVAKKEILSVIANLYDASTGCGLLYYTVENPDELGYQLGRDGVVLGDGVAIRPFGCRKYRDMVISTKEKLCVAVHYINVKGGNSITVEKDGCDTITVELIQREMEHVSAGDGIIVVSPIGMRINSVGRLGYEHFDEIDEVMIRYADGIEYVVLADLDDQNYDLDNRAYALGKDGTMVVYAFNRIVDVGNITEVVINGTVYPVN